MHNKLHMMQKTADICKCRFLEEKKAKSEKQIHFRFKGLLFLSLKPSSWWEERPSSENPWK